MPDSSAGVVSDAVIIPRGVAFDRVMLAAGLSWPVAVGITDDLQLGIVFGVLVLPFVVLALRNVLRRPPLLRGDGRGLWFGRGRIVPWPEVKHMYVATGLSGTTDGIRIKLARWSTWLRLPLSVQAMSMLVLGKIVVTTRHVTGASDMALLAKLEAMRTRAVGTEDGVLRDAEALPRARLVGGKAK